MAQGKPVSSPRVSVSSPYKGHCEEKQHIQSACSEAQAPYFTDMSADFIKTATEFRGTRGERRILTHSLSHSDDTIINIFLWTEASCPSPESQPVKNTDLGCRGSRRVETCCSGSRCSEPGGVDCSCNKNRNQLPEWQHMKAWGRKWQQVMETGTCLTLMSES